MTLLPSRWAVREEPDDSQVATLAHALNLPIPLARILVQRGLGGETNARQFLRPSLDGLSNPLDLPNMEPAVARIVTAIQDGELILVHGDYDVDGQSATALLTRALRLAGATVTPFIPNRLVDGYDLGPAGVREAAQSGARLIVTCDCGTTATGAVEEAASHGIDVVVTDHHTPGERLPAAVAVVNPRLGDPEADAADLCGAGVAFKLVQAVCASLGISQHLPFHFLDLVALATVADVVPLRRENRVLVRFGLKQLANSRWPGIRALLSVVGLAGRPVRAGHVGFVIGPRLNAAGRIGEAMDGLALLLTDDERDALDRARRLDTLNAQRQEIDQRILDQAIETVEQEIDLDDTFGLVLAREDWHAGVIGIVASRLVERYARPAILIALTDDTGKGSGRSIAGFDLHSALVACAPHLQRFGGHKMAAGLTIARGDVDAFRDAFDQVAHDRLSADDLVPTQRIDQVVALDRMDGELERLLRHLEPCGAGNPAPVFGVERANGRGPRPVGTNHLRFTLDDGHARLTAIGFGWADRVEPSWWDRPLDVAFRLERDDWGGVPKIQARVLQIRPSA